MKPDAFDRSLMEQVSQLPPDPRALEDYTPWQASIRKMMLGMALNAFRLEFFYLQYLLPLLGAVLLYLGCRSLRSSGPWFRLCWKLSALLLAAHMAVDILAATPVIPWVTDRPSLDYALAGIRAGFQFLLLFALRAGIRRAFTTAGEDRPTDWLGRGLTAYLLCIAVALWSELSPAWEQGMIGISITNHWLYYGRPVLFIALEIYLLRCILLQSEALAGRGYDIVPAPVRLPGSRFALAVFAAVLLAIPAALFASSRLPTLPTSAVAAPTAEAQAARERLIGLGLPRQVAESLDEEELARYTGARQVISGKLMDGSGYDPEQPAPEGSSVSVRLGNGEAELSVWAIRLADGSVRVLQFFRYTALPSLRLQDQFSADPSGYFHADDFAGGLLWDREGTAYAAQIPLQLAGGETAEEVPEWIAWVYQDEFDTFGRRHFSPWFNFSIPAGAEGLRGWLAYTVHPQESQSGAVDGSFGDLTYLFLRHQSSLLHYPFASISDLGGQRTAGAHGAIETAWAAFEFYVPG